MFVKGKKCLLRENMYIYRMEERVEMWNEKRREKISQRKRKKKIHEHKNVIKYIGFCKRSHIMDRGIKKKKKEKHRWSVRKNRRHLGMWNDS